MDSRGTAGASMLIDRIVAFVTDAGAIALFVLALIVAGALAVAVIFALRRHLRQAAERTVHDIARCNLRLRNVLKEDALSLFRRENPFAWIDSICRWKAAYPVIGKVFPMADLDRRLDQAALYLVAYLAVKENDLRMMPDELKGDLYGALRRLSRHYPLGTIVKLMSALDRLGSLPTAFDYIPPEQLEEAPSRVRLFRDELKEWFDKAQTTSSWEGVGRHLGIAAGEPAELAAAPGVGPGELAYLLCVYDRVRAPELRGRLQAALVAAYRRFGPVFRQVACIVDKYLVANGDLLRRLEGELAEAVEGESFGQVEAWTSFIRTYGQSPFAVLGASYLHDATTLTRRYMELLLRYQPETYEADDLAERKLELIEAWKAIDDLKTAGLVG